MKSLKIAIYLILLCFPIIGILIFKFFLGFGIFGSIFFGSFAGLTISSIIHPIIKTIFNPDYRPTASNQMIDLQVFDNDIKVIMSFLQSCEKLTEDSVPNELDLVYPLCEIQNAVNRSKFNPRIPENLRDQLPLVEIYLQFYKNPPKPNLDNKKPRKRKDDDDDFGVGDIIEFSV